MDHWWQISWLQFMLAEDNWFTKIWFSSNPATDQHLQWHHTARGMGFRLCSQSSLIPSCFYYFVPLTNFLHCQTLCMELSWHSKEQFLPTRKEASKNAWASQKIWKNFSLKTNWAICHASLICLLGLKRNLEGLAFHLLMRLFPVGFLVLFVKRSHL